MKSNIIVLKCITNLHVGDGDENYNLIDNEVEKDCVTGYPTIHSSGIKGALREYFKSNNLEDINEIFGGEAVSGKSNDHPDPGKIKFLSADMVARPARATAGNRPYYLITTEKMLERYQYLAKEFLSTTEVIKEADEEKNIKVEGIKPEAAYELKASDEPVYKVREEQFKMIDLPVMARNKLDNGVSKNLWHEEVVPHESIFVFPVIANDKDEEIYGHFIKNINNKVIQFGGNASIGYGLCKVTVLD